MRLWMTLGCIIALCGGMMITPGRAEDPKKPPEKLMRRKLGHAQRILEGIAVKDFDAIEKNADELILVSKKAEFLALKTPDYERQTNDFRNSRSKSWTPARKRTWTPPRWATSS